MGQLCGWYLAYCGDGETLRPVDSIPSTGQGPEHIFKVTDTHCCDKHPGTNLTGFVP